MNYRDSRNKKLPPTPSVLDFGVFRGHMWVPTLGAHESAKALQAIQKTVGRWTNSPRGGLAVFNRSGAEYDEKQRVRAVEAEAKHRELVGRLLPSRADAKASQPRQRAHSLPHLVRRTWARARRSGG